MRPVCLELQSSKSKTEGDLTAKGTKTTNRGTENKYSIVDEILKSSLAWMEFHGDSCAARIRRLLTDREPAYLAGRMERHPRFPGRMLADGCGADSELRDSGRFLRG